MLPALTGSSPLVRHPTLVVGPLYDQEAVALNPSVASTCPIFSSMGQQPALPSVAAGGHKRPPKSTGKDPQVPGHTGCTLYPISIQD